ncbi:Cell division cycle protein 16 -like protein [Sarcoptes scabiei]|nr:Cell division cycle protein 16 -like protein [Sarcoptes scabiei]
MIVTKNNAHLKDLSMRHLAARCFFECKEYNKALEIIGNNDDSCGFHDEMGGTFMQWRSSLELLKGYIYEALNDKDVANKCFLDALEMDINCVEAFEELIKFEMITEEQINRLLKIFQSNQNVKILNDVEEERIDEDNHKCIYEVINEDNSKWLREYYQTQLSKIISLKKNSENNQLKSIDRSNSDENDRCEICDSLKNCDDFRLIEAETLYEDYQFEESYEILSEIYSKDCFNTKCLLLLIGCLFELRNSIKISHKLVEAIPEDPITWYAVGCYYYSISNLDEARKYFNKSTLIDPNFQASLLMYGHSFEMEALHDQAISIYLDLSKVMTQSHLPLLYVGIEYSHLNNPTMAQQYLEQAQKLCPNNIFIIHEIGIVHYQRGDYQKALKNFSLVFEMLSKRKYLNKSPRKWEPLLNNLGHVHRKLGNYDEAIFYYDCALNVIPHNHSTLDSLGLVYSLKGEHQMAYDCFQKALALKRDDAFASTMLNLVFEQLLVRQ